MPASGIVTFLFTDIAGSTRLWEEDPVRMQPAMAHHDAIARAAVAQHRGTLVKMTGDGVHAAFDDPLDAVSAALQMQLELARMQPLRLEVRCGIHPGAAERRDGDYYGAAINRAARIMAAAHGSQVLVSQPVAALVAGRVPAGVEFRDLGEVRLRDLASPERLLQLLHPALRADFPPLRSLASTPNNLPQQLTSFVGRESELADVVARVRQSRLVTLVGPGGIGKTRLSLQAAAELLDEFPDGVFFVEFASVADARLLPQAAASVLGVKEEAGRPVVEAVVRHVADRRLLLIFDNCEHLVQGCADLATALLRASAGLHVLASSREALAVAGEQVLMVPALTLPDMAALAAGTADDAARRFIEDTLRGSEAARLFVERAEAARSDFRVTADNGAAIAGICRRLDGIPLAIELAAARTRTMSVTGIEERLSDRFRLLAGGDRTALPRQQTLRALIDWSYELLTEPERALLRRLAVFSGGFTLDAAEAVGRVDGAGDDVLDLLTRLVEKSLVTFDAARGRYGLLETVRDYTAQRLEGAGETRATRTRHFAFYAALGREAGEHLFGAGQAQWLERLDGERENVLSAFAHGDGSDSGEAALDLACAIKYYWFNRGLLELGHRTMVDTLAQLAPDAAPRLRALGLMAAGQYASWRGRYAQAESHLREGLAIARASGDSMLVAKVLQPMSLAALGLGDREAARGYLEEALAIARASGDKRELASALNQVAQLERIDGRTARAAEHYAQALAIARELEDSAIVTVTLLNLAMTAITQGAPGEAAPLLQETLAIAQRSDDRLGIQCALDVCTALASARGDFMRAARFHGSAQAQMIQLGMERDPVDASFLAPWVARARSELGATAMDEAAATSRALDLRAAVQDAEGWLGGLPR
jgi:predicted ATPase/class 3 adenylate cyclase